MTNGTFFGKIHLALSVMCTARKTEWGHSSAGSPAEAVNNPRTGNIKIKHHNLSYLGV